jgi:hypothetical protein
VDDPLAAAGLLAEFERSHDGRPRLLGAHVEILAGDAGDEF